jgi:glucose-6-phosphate 1-epimerase
MSLPVVVARHAASGAELRIHPFGATVTSWKTGAGQEVLFVSSAADLSGARPIRGGIPVAFPQFGAQGPLPMHGFARTAVWETVAVEDGAVEMALRDDEATRALWPHAFALR